MGCWVRGTSTEPFIAGEVASVEDATLEVRLASGELRSVRRSDAFPSSSRTATDHCALPHLNEPCVLENTRARYKENAIYTSIGDVLVAVNPFATLMVHYHAVDAAAAVGSNQGGPQ